MLKISVSSIKVLQKGSHVVTEMEMPVVLDCQTEIRHADTCARNSAYLLYRRAIPPFVCVIVCMCVQLFLHKIKSPF